MHGPTPRGPINLYMEFGKLSVVSDQIVNILGFAGHVSMLQLLSSAFVAQKKVQAICKQVSMDMFQ